MFAITEGTRKVYGKEITTYTREIYSANVLEVEAGTNLLGRDGDEGFELFLGGDCELETMIRALKFITKALEDGAKEVHD